VENEKLKKELAEIINRIRKYVEGKPKNKFPWLIESEEYREEKDIENGVQPKKYRRRY